MASSSPGPLRRAALLLSALAILAGSPSLGPRAESAAPGTAAPSIDKICDEAKGEADELLATGGDLLAALTKMKDAVQGEARAAGEDTRPPPGPAAAGPAPSAGPAAPAFVIAKTDMAIASATATLAAAKAMRDEGQALMDAAKRESDPAKQREKYLQAHAKLTSAKRLTQNTTITLYSASSRRLEFKSEAFGQLKTLTRGYAESPQRRTSEVAISLRGFDGAAQRAEAVVRANEPDYFQARQHREPGGIKFDSQRAEKQSLPLDITAMEFDPVRGQLILMGGSTQTFDLDIFADVLRLAVEDGEPFFSLESSNAEDWDYKGIRESREIRKRYTDQEVAERVRKLSPSGLRHGELVYYYTTTDVFDPKIVAQARRGRDITSKLVFSPTWLRTSKVGWILYEADLAIKGVAAGFLERDGAVEPAPNWRLPDFDPKWLHRDSEHAGRANFELAKLGVPQHGGRLDLAAIRPQLYMTERRSGTSQDLKPSKRDQLIMDHFAAHWSEYAAAVPEIGRLQMVYRAYVAARFLAREHPGLAQRIRAMPRSKVPIEPPLLSIQPRVLRVAYRGDALVPIVPGTQIYYDIGGGFGGGAAFRMSANIGAKPSPSTEASHAWADAARAAQPGKPLIRNGSQALAVIEFDSHPLPAARRALLAAGLALLAALAGGAALLKRGLDWQRMSAGITCPHCRGVHRRLGRAALGADIAAAAALLYLCALPLAAAAHEERLGFLEGAAALVLLAGLLAALFLAGSAWLALLSRSRRLRPLEAGPAAAFFCGTRLAALAAAAWMFCAGFSSDAAAQRLLGASREIAERLLLALGGPAPLAGAAALAAGAALAALLLRWGAPFALGSRPLPLAAPDPHFHSS